MKRISRFLPTPSRTPEECEHHYVSVHIPMAQDLLTTMPALLSYHVNRAVAEADIAGGWQQPPHAWRYVLLRFAGEDTLRFSAEQQDMVALDHVNCLYKLRSSELEEEVLLDRLDGQVALTKFLIEADRSADATPEEAWAAFRRIADDIAQRMETAFGARRLTLNRALNEGRTEAVDVEGQRPVGMLPETTRVGYIECWFDHERWGRETLAPLARGVGLLRDLALKDCYLLQVEEHAPIDRSDAPEKVPSGAPISR